MLQVELRASRDEVKQQLIGRRNRSIVRQGLNELKQTIPVTEIDDPLITDPPRLVDFDRDRDQLTLALSRPVNEMWVWAFRNMGGHTSFSDVAR